MRAWVVSLFLMGSIELTGMPAHADEPRSPSYRARVAAGAQSAARGDFAAALHNLRDAVDEAPGLPDAHCLLANTERARGAFEPALTAYRTCLRLARETNDRMHAATALHGIAGTFERMGNLPEARTGWLEYVRFAESSGGTADARIGRARLDAIDRILAEDGRAEPVRTRHDRRSRSQ